MAYEYIRKVMVMPLNCPYCDEPAFPRDHGQRVVTPNAIFTPRQCIMGHEFWSKEEVPVDQDATEKYIQKQKRAHYNEYMKKYRSTVEFQKKMEEKRKQWKLYKDAEKRAKKTAKDFQFKDPKKDDYGLAEDIVMFDEGE